MPSVKDMTTTTAAPPARILRQIGIDTQYVLIGFPLGIVGVVLCMSIFWLGVGLSIIWIGLPILLGVMYLARGLAVMERARIGPVFRQKLQHPYYKKPTGDGFVRRLLAPLSDGQSWLDLLHGMFRFIPSTISFAFVITWWAGVDGNGSDVMWRA